MARAIREDQIRNFSEVLQQCEDQAFVRKSITCPQCETTYVLLCAPQNMDAAQKLMHEQLLSAHPAHGIEAIF